MSFEFSKSNEKDTETINQVIKDSVRGFIKAIAPLGMTPEDALKFYKEQREKELGHQESKEE